MTALRNIKAGAVHIEWGTITTRNCTIHTLWSLQDRGLVRLPDVGKPRLTPFGIQFMEA